MKTREQVTATGDFPAAGHQNAALMLLAVSLGEMAGGKGMRIIRDAEWSTQNTLWMKDIGTEGKPRLVECSQSEADTVRVTLTAWAEPK